MTFPTTGQTNYGASVKAYIDAQATAVNVKLYGAVGDGTTDDTAAVNSAIAYLNAITATDSSRATNQPILYFPPGRYRITAGLTTMTVKIKIVGAGPDSSVIWYDPTSDTTGAVVLEFGTFSATPADLWAGDQDVAIQGLRIQHASPGAAGSRKGQAIRQPGGGGLIARNVSVMGFAYGFNNPYGGDFNHFDNTLAEYCDVGYYMGPGAQQVIGLRLNAFGCVEGMVLDRCAHLHLTMPIFNSCATSGLTIEAITDTTTRQLTSFSTSGTSYAGKIVLETPWFESNAGGLGDAYTPTHYIQCSNGGGDAYRNIEIVNPYVIGGGPTKTTTSLIGSISGTAPQKVRVLRPVLRGALTYWLYNVLAGIEDPYTPSGYTAPSVSNVTTAGWLQKASTAAGEETWQVGTLPIIQKYERSDHAHGNSLEHDVAGVLRLGFETGGTWYTRLGFDIQNRKVFLDDPNTSTSPSLSRSSAQPSSGSYGIGSFVFNTAPTVSGGKTLLGWQRLTTGSGHVAGTDWSPCYVTNT